MPRRPKPPKHWRPNADDKDVQTKYSRAEYCVGDSMKVINRQLEDMIYIDGLQRHEILGMIESSIRLHFPDAVEEFEDGTSA